MSCSAAKLCICTILCACTIIVSRASAAPAAGATRVAVLPLRDGGAADARIEAAVIEAVQAMPGFAVANASNGKLTAPKKMDVRLDPQPAARALALGKETNAQRALALDATPLGDGLVVYVQAIEVPSGRPLGSTTASLSGGGATRSPGDRDLMRAALVRVLDPSRYVGRVQLKVDVQGAQIEIDGKPVSGNSVDLPVGTHALRGTHPAYHDFLRFLDVEFDKTLYVDVNMAMYPLAEGEMTERTRRGLPVARKKLPWWRTWPALTGAGIILTGATVGVVFLLRPGIQSDTTTTYKPTPTP